ncbi:zinc carboxypeptidase [Maribacter spongiicola]|uniref:Zinc carboxypeptidase n=1 Tax=Maribacter spongiicola TaxID=1206753 RepID=A0A4V3EQ21_9FLAO|nr:M14 family metallopeptidase [Maribacter spongiicola]TDT39578.1 zinc carboxypeptidase [Maribacter spongiicola]
MKNLSLFFLALLIISCESKVENTKTDFPTPFEISNKTETATYDQVIDFYLKLSQEFSTINIQTIGTTDSGKPLHVVSYSAKGDFDFKKLGENNTMMLINNGIHPGESDGIDAAMLLFRDLASNEIETPKETIIATIPIYNVGGALNRNSTSRANQNGPLEYGFRGNAKNYDLNRDFIKSDTKNAETFAKIFHLINPDVFIDNHVSNGADYQYTLTHLFTQHNKLGGKLGDYVHNSLMPQLQDSLLNSGWDITPYVNVFNSPPEKGFQQFMDSPRYSTGYTTLWNTVGMMVETHMLKPYDKRVEGTYELMRKMISITEKDGPNIRAMRDQTLTSMYPNRYYPTAYKIDPTKASNYIFKGYKADTIISEVTGLKRLKYDRNTPIETEVTYNDFYVPSDSVKIPKAYVIGKQWRNIIDQLDLNSIHYTTLQKDSTINIESYKINEYETYKAPYEGHYPHYNTTVKAELTAKEFHVGDIMIPIDQPGFRYLIETLEPAAVDSFFNWNFFDTILQQKEGFSPYVFEDTALDMLENDTILKLEFEEQKRTNPDFSENWYQQLDWIFKRSKLYEEAHLQYPVFRIVE